MLTALHVAPHPDDEALGCPGVLFWLRDHGWTVVSLVASLGFPAQQVRRRAEAAEAARRAGFDPVFLDPPLDISLDDDLAAATARVTAEVTKLVATHDVSVVISPSPHDVHHGHECVARGVQQALARTDGARWWMWGIWGDLPAPNLFFPFGDGDLEQMLDVLDVYAGELARNDYRRFLKGRAAANAVLGSERVFGFGSPAATSLPYAELLTEVGRRDARWMAAAGRTLDDAFLAPNGALAQPDWTLDLTAWIESPSVRQLVGPVPEVSADTTS